jgi:hypothetical protein
LKAQLEEQIKARNEAQDEDEKLKNKITNAINLDSSFGMEGRKKLKFSIKK